MPCELAAVVCCFLILDFLGHGVRSAARPKTCCTGVYALLAFLLLFQPAKASKPQFLLLCSMPPCNTLTKSAGFKNGQLKIPSPRWGWKLVCIPLVGRSSCVASKRSHSPSVLKMSPGMLFGFSPRRSLEKAYLCPNMLPGIITPFLCFQHWSK